MSYAYRAARADGAFELGVLTAESREAAATALTSRGLLPIELRLERTGGPTRVRLAPRDVAIGLRILATLLDSGLSLSRALAAMPELVPPGWHAVLPMIQTTVSEGASLGAALRQSPRAFPPVVVGIIAAGEAGSGIAGAVRRAADVMEVAAATRAAVRNALAYPLLLAITGAASVVLLVGVVLPRFGTILADLGQALPPTTRLVLGAAIFARRWAALMGVLLALALLLLRAWIATDAGRARWDAAMLEIPVIGPVRRSMATGRACAALVALLESGVPLAASLPHAARAAGDAALAERLLAAREAIVIGGRPSRALAEAAALTPTAIRLIRAGEESGRMAAMCAQAATLETERAEQAVKSAVRLVEPALILTFGGVVALVAAALLQAIYSIRPV